MKDNTEVMLEIKSVQDGVESVLFISDARMNRHKGYRQIEFDGTEICGVPGEITSFRVYDGDNVAFKPSVELCTKSKNRLSSEMTFEQGVKQHCHYVDMFDEPVVLGFLTRRVESSLTEDGGNVEIDYTVEYNNRLSSRNSMKLTVKKV